MARRKPTATTSSPVETFEQASTRIVLMLRREGMVTADERLSRLQRLAWPALGGLAVTSIRSGQISRVLEAAARAGLSQQTVKHLRMDMGKIFAELVRDEVLESNPARGEKIRLPRAKQDKRKRTLLNDDEFIALILAPTTPRQIAAMSVCSRCFGGLRPSDIYAWVWGDIDTETWNWADAPRPKTEHAANGDDMAPRERIELPELVAHTLRRWWEGAGRPVAGPVFPHPIPMLARQLRVALRAAGVLRQAIHVDLPTTATSKGSRRVDFYSFRRAWVTAIARSGMVAQLAMRATGHKSMATHQRYHIPDTLQIPGAAVPVLPEPGNIPYPDNTHTGGDGIPKGECCYCEQDPCTCDAFEAALEAFDPNISNGIKSNLCGPHRVPQFNAEQSPATLRLKLA